MQGNSTESPQVMHHILGLAQQVEQLQSQLEAINASLQTTSSQTQNVDRNVRNTNLTVGGIARVIDDNQVQLQQVANSISTMLESIHQLPTAQIETSVISESIQQVVYDAIDEALRHLNETKDEQNTVDIEQERVNARRHLAATLLPKLEQVLKTNDTQQQDQLQEIVHLQEHAAYLHREIIRIQEETRDFQQRALALLKEMQGHQPSMLLLMFFRSDPKKADPEKAALLSKLTTLINANNREEHYQQLADTLSQHLNALTQHNEKICQWVQGMNEVRKQLLALWGDEDQTTTMNMFQSQPVPLAHSQLQENDGLSTSMINEEEDTKTRGFAFPLPSYESDEDDLLFSEIADEDETRGTILEDKT